MLVWSETSPHDPLRHPGQPGRARLKARNDAFKSSDTVSLKTATANLTQARLAKRAHGQKVQDFFKHPTNT